MFQRLLGGILALSFLVAPAYCQINSSATVVISARLPGSITLSLRSTPVSISVANGAQSRFTVPLSVQWNLDPREVPAFGVIAYFRNPSAALTDSSNGTPLPAEAILAKWGNASFGRFNQVDGSLPIFHTAVTPNDRRGALSQPLELKISDEAVSSLSNGDYQGVLYLEVRNY
jgi:hypothetical protein